MHISDAVRYILAFWQFHHRQDFLDKVKTLWPRRSLEWNIYLTADVITDDNYKA